LERCKDVEEGSRDWKKEGFHFYVDIAIREKEEQIWIQWAKNFGSDLK
jgi:hypothetical protein